VVEKEIERRKLSAKVKVQWGLLMDASGGSEGTLKSDLSVLTIMLFTLYSPFYTPSLPYVHLLLTGLKME